jgi:K+-sensing histidine kinase KdpD
MSNILTCHNCQAKPCKKTENDTFDICQYGVSFVNRNGFVETKEPKIPLSTIAKNLRHEINPILQSIIEQTTNLDCNLSTKTIFLNNPLSVIIGNTVILDNFIQMITGVHEFHSTPSNISQKAFKLKDLINYYFTVYSIIKEEGRTEKLSINNLIDEKYLVEKYSDFIKYILVILIDNAWKYSINNSTLTVNLVKISNEYYNIEIVNQSKKIPNDLNIFEMGTKANENTKGFGYGLYWIKTLENSYNTLSENNDDIKLQIVHEQIPSQSIFSFQKFTIKNINLNTR